MEVELAGVPRNHLEDVWTAKDVETRFIVAIPYEREIFPLSRQILPETVKAVTREVYDPTNTAPNLEQLAEKLDGQEAVLEAYLFQEETGNSERLRNRGGEISFNLSEYDLWAFDQLQEALAEDGRTIDYLYQTDQIPTPGKLTGNPEDDPRHLYGPTCFEEAVYVFNNTPSHTGIVLEDGSHIFYREDGYIDPDPQVEQLVSNIPGIMEVPETE